ncbi:recombinase family protein [Dehalococcoides mccartyi]|uniref:recombinase family protein n=1 Tax=Dehalococcoides mccartyi TaxID=61435 RepID=UPI001CE4D41C|nr:recombinase family protein [Dehalococcoides mccartyi]QYY58441.1 recombinase family protein [Dehalococcoides mccartyi]
MSNGIAGIWARVSTEPQQSLDSQVARAKAELEKKGYTVPPERILKVDWTSLDLFNCPQFQELRGWIQRKEIAALGIFDRDRLNAIGLQRLIFLSDCKEKDVELVICQGPAILNEPEGQLVELALAIGKERQVLRAQQGSRDALRERATVKRLPTTCQAPYGYKWDDSRTKLLANANWETRSFIVKKFIKGSTLKGITRELEKQGIPSPKGRDFWSEPTISLILRDTVNYGEYRALRRESVEPASRRGNTYGKSSSKYLPGLPLTNIVVEKPVINQAEYDLVIEKLARNKTNAKRNGKRDYLLRGMIVYEGDNLRYHGFDIRHSSWAYRYSKRGYKNGNPKAYLPGRKTEDLVEARAREILSSDKVLEQEYGWRAEAIKESIGRLEDEMKRLDRKSNENINAESELVNLRIRGKVSDEAYDRQMVMILAERKWISEERQRIQQKHTDLKQQAVSLTGLDQLREQMSDKILSDSFDDRRFVLESLQTRIIVTTDGRTEIEFTIGDKKHPGGSIVLSSPLNACPQYSIVLLEHPLLTIR